MACVAEFLTPDWQFALAIALVGFTAGFVAGYGIRAFISHRRRRAARLHGGMF
jgi:hypothetical protein